MRQLTTTAPHHNGLVWVAGADDLPVVLVQPKNDHCSRKPGLLSHVFPSGVLPRLPAVPAPTVEGALRHHLYQRNANGNKDFPLGYFTGFL